MPVVRRKAGGERGRDELSFVATVLRRLFLLALLTATGAAAHAQTGSPQPGTTRTIQVPLTTAAKLAIAGGDLEGARRILAQELAAEPRSVEARFLLGQIEGQQENWDKAAEQYRIILVDHPELTRVRLELARALFELKDDVTAEYHFRLAMAAPEVPEALIDNVSRYLAAIRTRKNYSFFLDIGIAPDTNLNAAPAQSQVALFGIPFQLSEEARQKSGVGIVASVNGEYLIPLGTANDDRWRAGGSLYRTEYAGGAFDDMQLRAQTGPQFRFPLGDVSLLGVYAQRWFANDPYNRGYGGRIEAGYSLTPQLRLDGFLEGLSVRYDTQTFLDGAAITSALFTTWGLDQQSYLRFIAGAGTERTRFPGFSNYSTRFGVGYLRNFPFGVTAYVQPEIQLYNYDARNELFGVERYDRIYRVQLSFYKRDFQILGFSPTFNYYFTYDDSNIEFYSFTRNQVQIGFTREF